MHKGEISHLKPRGIKSHVNIRRNSSRYLQYQVQMMTEYQGVVVKTVV